VVCWAATEARLVSARHTETGERARGMSRILYRGPETGDTRRVVRLELVGVKHRRKGPGKSDTSENLLEDEDGQGGGGEREGGTLISIG
jgi:hypothetical protein